MSRVWMFIIDYKIETGAVITLICAIAFILFTAHSCVQDMNEAGGLRAVVVESGKEIKSIIKDINEE